MRSLRVLVGVGALLALAVPARPARAGAGAGPTASDASLASAHPLHRLVERERAPGRLVGRAVESLAAAATPPAPRAIRSDVATSPLDCIHASHDLELDPRTGATTATLELVVRARGGPLGAVGFLIDEGLSVRSVTSEGREATARDAVAAPTRAVEVALSPPVADGESATIRVAYGGTLACSSSPESGALVCKKGASFSYFSHQSVFPFLFDPTTPDDASLDTMTRDIVVRVPADVDVVASGERVSEAVTETTRTSTWTIDRPLSRVLGMYVFTGALGRSTVPGRVVPTTLVYPAPERAIDQRLLAWSAPVLDFVEKVGGARLPFQRSMTLVRLPGDIGDPGTATFGMTLLSDSYAQAGDLMHEETWLHENSHLFWGIVVPERSSAESRMMSEGLATLAEIDYTFATHFQGEDRDRYLARRFVPIGLDLRAYGTEVPPVWLGEGQRPPDASRTSLYTAWAYTKTAATLDHLRETIGDDRFERALAAYVEACSFVGCGPADFRAVLERTTGEDLGAFFDRWVTASTRPVVTVSFQPSPGGADVELTKADDAPMTLQLSVRLEDGQLLKRRVDLRGRTTRVHLDAPSGVRSVQTSARHDVMVDARSGVDGDLDFDGETDGFDMLRCSRLVGTSYRSQSGLGLWSVSEQFDPRCDLDGDQRVDDEDLMKIARRFGKLREP